MNRIFAAALLGAAAVVAAPQAAAGPAGAALSKCILESTNDADRVVLVRWMVGALSQHSSLDGQVKVDAKAMAANDSAVAKLFERLLTESCPRQVRDTIAKEGTDVLGAAFGDLGKLAGEQAFKDPAVERSMQNMFKQVDTARIGKLLSEKP